MQIPYTSAIITNMIIPSSIETGQGRHSPGGGGGEPELPPVPSDTPHGHGSGPCEKASVQSNTSRTVDKNLSEILFIIFKNRESD